MFNVTCIAPVNMATIKYWGKRDEDLILPINGSLSLTVSTDQMCSKTTAAASDTFKKNVMWLNGEIVEFDENPRVKRCLMEIRRLAAKKSPKFPLDWKLHVCSKNNFPTAAGLASSAAGYACLVYTLACLYGVEDEDLATISRQGSGSACRSIYGGFVEWIKGELEDGSDSTAVQVQPAEHWPEMHMLILVVNDVRKKTSSTNGMRSSVQTSELLKYRADVCVPKRTETIKQAIKRKDFAKFAEITMKDSNQFHAICLDSYPPVVYMNDTSQAIVQYVHKFNAACGSNRAAYTFDAGPNACIFLEEKDVPYFIDGLNKFMPNDNASSVEYVRGIPVSTENIQSIFAEFENELKPVGHNLLKYIIHTKIGDGPKKLEHSESLINEAGLPN